MQLLSRCVILLKITFININMHHTFFPQAVIYLIIWRWRWKLKLCDCSSRGHCYSAMLSSTVIECSGCKSLSWLPYAGFFTYSVGRPICHFSVVRSSFSRTSHLSTIYKAELSPATHLNYNGVSACLHFHNAVLCSTLAGWGTKVHHHLSCKRHNAMVHHTVVRTLCSGS